MAKWRHEYKYLSPEPLLKVLQERASRVMPLDPHTGDSGFYHIRSIYFDDIDGTCYRENEDGTDPREKFRIRVYGNSDERVSLELKSRRMGKCLKTSCPLSRERLRAVMDGDMGDSALAVRAGDPFLYRKFRSQVLYRSLRPVCAVCYDRVPFVWKEGNVRVTFDRNIRSASDLSRFLDPRLPARAVLPAGTNLLEVKFDEFLPDFIYEILQTGELRQTSFSKYYICRKFGMRQTIR